MQAVSSFTVGHTGRLGFKANGCSWAVGTAEGAAKQDVLLTVQHLADMQLQGWPAGLGGNCSPWNYSSFLESKSRCYSLILHPQTPTVTQGKRHPAQTAQWARGQGRGCCSVSPGLSCAVPGVTG